MQIIGIQAPVLIQNIKIRTNRIYIKWIRNYVLNLANPILCFIFPLQKLPPTQTLQMQAVSFNGPVRSSWINTNKNKQIRDTVLYQAITSQEKMKKAKKMKWETFLKQRSFTSDFTLYNIWLQIQNLMHMLLNNLQYVKIRNNRIYLK